MAANMPYVVARAMADVDTLTLFAEMGRAPRAVFRYLVSLVDAKNAIEPVWPSKEKIAEKTGYAVAQVYRALNKLIDAGLIVRVSQTRSSRSGRLGRGLISLTTHACRLLKLPVKLVEKIVPKINVQDNSSGADLGAPETQGAEKPDLPPAAHARMAEMIDGHITTQAKPVHFQSLQKQSKRHHGECAPVKKTTKVGNANIPDELVFVIHEKMLTLGQLLKLMGEASKVGKRLSDIVAVRRARLKTLWGNKLFAYLRTLIRSETDFAWLKKEQASQQSATQEKQDWQRTREQAKHALAGKWLDGKPGRRYKVQLIGDSLYVEHYQDGAYTGCRPLDADFMTAVSKGALRLACPA